MSVIQFPSSPPPSDMSRGYLSHNYGSKTLSGRYVGRKQGTTLLTFDLTWSDLTREQMANIHAALCSLEGTFGRAELLVPVYSSSSNINAPATATVLNAANARQDQVTLSGFPANRQVLNVGDYVRFSNHSKVYILAQPATSNASGQVTLTLTFDLISALPVGVTASFKDVRVRCGLPANKLNLDSSGLLESVSVSFVERLT